MSNLSWRVLCSTRVSVKRKYLVAVGNQIRCEGVAQMAEAYDADAPDDEFVWLLQAC